MDALTASPRQPVGMAAVMTGDEIRSQRSSLLVMFDSRPQHCDQMIHRLYSLQCHLCTANRLIHVERRKIIKIENRFICFVTENTPSRQRLRSAEGNYLVVPRHRLATYGSHAFVIAGPSAWNDLPDELHDISVSRTVFRSRLKTYFLSYY